MMQEIFFDLLKFAMPDSADEELRKIVRQFIASKELHNLDNAVLVCGVGSNKLNILENLIDKSLKEDNPFVKRKLPDLKELAVAKIPFTPPITRAERRKKLCS